MAAAKGTKPPGGSRKGKPNKNTAELKDMILKALSNAGGVAYLTRQANENPKAFMGLLGKVLPQDHKVSAHVTGKLIWIVPEK